MAADVARMSSPRPGTMRSHTSSVASGVTSRGDRPVPPQVTHRAASAAAASRMASPTRERTSGTTVAETTLNPSRARSSATAGPVASSRRPAAERSLTVMTAAEKLGALVSWSWCPMSLLYLPNGQMG